MGTAQYHRPDDEREVGGSPCLFEIPIKLFNEINLPSSYLPWSNLGTPWTSSRLRQAIKCIAHISTSDRRCEVIPTSLRKLTQAGGNATPSDVRARARTWACSIREEKTLRRWSTWGGGCCQVQIEQGGFRALKHRGRGVPHRSPRRASKESSTEPEAKGREARQASQPDPPGQPSLFQDSGGGPLGSRVSCLRGPAWIRPCHCSRIAASGNIPYQQHKSPGLGP